MMYFYLGGVCMSDEKYTSMPLPETIEKKCELCGRTTLVAKDLMVASALQIYETGLISSDDMEEAAGLKRIAERDSDSCI